MKGIVWLSSYPKSGNTWFRTFLSHLTKEEDEEITINHLKTSGIFSSRGIVDEVIGFETSNMTHDEIDFYRPEAFNSIARNAEKPLFIKVHDAYTFLPNGKPIMGTQNAVAIYIVRNPLDVAVSFAHHSRKETDRMITDMGRDDFAMCAGKKRLIKQYRQKLLSWSGHVESWTSAKEIPVHVVRYEDMHASPVETFGAAVRFLGLEYSAAEIHEAISLSAFDKLKEQELEIGFKEKPTNANSFFREGKTGGWRKQLTEEQRDRIIRDHERVMQKWGYLDEDGNPVY